MTLLGGTFAAVGMMLSYFAWSIPYLYIRCVCVCVFILIYVVRSLTFCLVSSYGVFVGTGAGLSFPPTVYIVTSYFVRLRGLANGICISGSAFGSIFLPPLIRYLLETYGYRGTVLIMGGLTLNTWIAGIFYEPVENHLKRVPKNPPEEQELDDVIDEEDEGITLEFVNTPENATDEKIDDKSKTKITITSDDAPSTPKSHITSADTFKSEINGSEFARSVSAVAVQNFSRANHDDTAASHRQRKISTPVRGSHPMHNDSFVNQLSSTPSLYAVPESRFSHSSRLSRLNQHRSGSRAPKRSPSTSSFQYMSTPFHGSTLSIQPEDFASHLSLKSIASSINPVSSCSKKKDKGSNRFLDLSLLKDPIYLVILISNSTNAIGYTNFIIMLPSYANSLGFDKNLSAYLLSIVSALDLVGRIGGSALSDLALIPKPWYFVGGLAISGISLAVLPMATAYGSVSILCAIFGLASGTYVGITAVIMADMLGTERLTSSYGISLFVNGVLQLIGPPICGAWSEHMKSYTTVITTLGLVLTCGASLWGFVPFIQRNRQRQREKLEAEGIPDNEQELI